MIQSVRFPATSAYRSPLLQGQGVIVPVDLQADGVAHHAGEVGGGGGHRVEELPPQGLALQRHWGQRVVLRLVSGEGYTNRGRGKKYKSIPIHSYVKCLQMSNTSLLPPRVHSLELQ